MDNEIRERNNARWNVESLKEYFDLAICKVEANVIQRFADIEKAITKADAYTTYRDTKQNEFRDALDDQNKVMAEQVKAFARKEDLTALKSEFLVMTNGLSNLIDANFNSLQERINDMRKDFDKEKDQKMGAKTILPWVISLILFLIAVASFVLKFS